MALVHELTFDLCVVSFERKGLCVLKNESKESSFFMQDECLHVLVSRVSEIVCFENKIDKSILSIDKFLIIIVKKIQLILYFKLINKHLTRN